MATQMMADPATEQAEAPAQEGAEAGGYEICIKVAADGSMSVGVEKEGEEAMAPGPDGQPVDDDSAFTPVKGVKEALTACLEIYRSNGGQPASSPDMQAQFSQGFSGAK